MSRSALEALRACDPPPPLRTLDRCELDRCGPAPSQPSQDEARASGTPVCKHAPFVAWQLCDED